MPRTTTEHLIIGIGSNAVAIDRKTGAEIWRTEVKGSPYVTVMRDGAQVFVGAGGELFCLDARTGAVRWQNKLKGLGLGIISFDTSIEALMSGAIEAQREA